MVIRLPDDWWTSGVVHSERFEGGGTTSFQFVRTTDGRRIAAITWHDPP